MTETQMERAKRQHEQAKTRLYATKARETKLAHKRDTRRKVILGGALIDLSERDQPARSMMRRLIGKLAHEQDRKVFDLNIGAASDEASRLQESETTTPPTSLAARPTNEKAPDG